MRNTTEMIAESFAVALEACGDDANDISDKLCEDFFGKLDEAWTLDNSCASSLIVKDNNGEDMVVVNRPTGERDGFVAVTIHEVFTRSPDGSPDELVTSVTRFRNVSEQEAGYIEAGIQSGQMNVAQQRDALFR